MVKKIPTWAIYAKKKRDPKGTWYREKFLTGSRIYFDFKDAQKDKNKMNKMQSSFVFKVVKL